MPRNDGPCGRTIRAGESGFSIDGRLFCPSCFSAPNDGSVSYTEGMVPVDGRCGQVIEPAPVAEPSPLDPPLEVFPLPQPADQDNWLGEYAVYVEGKVAAEELPLPYVDWREAEALRRATAAVKTVNVAAESFTEILDEGVQAIIRLLEAAHALGQNDSDNA